MTDEALGLLRSRQARRGETDVARFRCLDRSELVPPPTDLLVLRNDHPAARGNLRNPLEGRDVGAAGIRRAGPLDLRLGRQVLVARTDDMEQTE
jgi:hypothetical protein